MATSTVVEPSLVGTPSTVASSATNQVLLVANAARRGATVYNDSTATLYWLNANAAATNAIYSVAIVAGGYYEIPYNYCGPVNGIWASANGNARIVEHT